ncbi:MAG: hypothetical protein LUD16_13310, partial [Lachnospiraceae bacterium]|nr:hypothetical protein [Lachnospiraceae bacterium]
TSGSNIDAHMAQIFVDIHNESIISWSSIFYFILHQSAQASISIIPINKRLLFNSDKQFHRLNSVADFMSCR